MASVEKWIYFINSDTSDQWYDIGQTALTVVKCKQFERTAMLYVWRNYEGEIHFEMVPNSKSIDAKLYSSQVDRMYQKTKGKIPFFGESQKSSSPVRQCQTTHTD